jgi:site-specific recombinase XerD
MRPVTVGNAVEDYLLDIIGLTPATQKERRMTLGVLCRKLEATRDLDSITTSDLRRLLADLSEHGARGRGPWRSATLASFVREVKPFFAGHVRESLLSQSPAAQLANPKIEGRVIEGFTLQHIKSLMTGDEEGLEP